MIRKITEKRAPLSCKINVITRDFNKMLGGVWEMKRYLLQRISRSLFSIFIVVSVVFTLIYTIIPRERVFFSDTNIEKLQKRPDDYLNYKNLQWERLGYIEYEVINDYCRLIYQVATDEYKACILSGSVYTHDFISLRESQGYEVNFFPDSERVYAVRDISNLQRIFNWWRQLIQIDHPNRVQTQGQEILSRKVYVGRDFNGNLALMCSGCEYKYLVYGNGQFPFIHQNFVRLNLGISYPTYSGQEVLEVLTMEQGNKVMQDVIAANGEVTSSALNLHSCRFKETLDHLDLELLGDHYADCKISKDEPSMMKISFSIGLASLVLSYVIGIPLGIKMAQYQGTAFDKIGQWYMVLMISIPSLAYIVLVRFLGGKYAGLPTMFPLLGAGDIRSYILPVISLTLGSIANRMMWMRRYMIDQTSMDYVRFARAKGLTENEIFYTHIFKNAIGPIAHGFPTAIIFCISGALITESVYSIPGMGKILPDSIHIYNNSMVIGITFIFTTLAILSRLLGDLLLTFLDPRITLHKKGGARHE